MKCKEEGCTNKVSRTGLCQKHYRYEAKLRALSGEKLKPGPRQDPTKPNSKHKPKTRTFATDTHCAKGHDFEAVGYYMQSTGKKQCKLCRANSQRKYRGAEPTEVVGTWNKGKTHCPKGHELSGDNLYTHPSSGARRCKACHKETARAWQLKNKYDLTTESYEEMFEEQKGECAICGSSQEVLVIDHDHTSGDVRALLCDGCNFGLGHFLDDPNRLVRAAEYVLAFSETDSSE